MSILSFSVIWLVVVIEFFWIIFRWNRHISKKIKPAVSLTHRRWSSLALKRAGKYGLHFVRRFRYFEIPLRSIHSHCSTRRSARAALCFQPASICFRLCAARLRELFYRLDNIKFRYAAFATFLELSKKGIVARCAAKIFAILKSRFRTAIEKSVEPADTNRCVIDFPHVYQRAKFSFSLWKRLVRTRNRFGADVRFYAETKCAPRQARARSSLANAIFPRPKTA